MANKPQPKRKQKAMFMQPQHAEAFEELAFIQRRLGGLTAPELSELAVLLVCEHFGADTSELTDTTKRG